MRRPSHDVIPAVGILNNACHHTQRLGITERGLFCKFDFYYYLCSCGLVKAFVTCRRYNS
nr:MAG TPA: hypothetical protein [Bacteriophage sp.]